MVCNIQYLFLYFLINHYTKISIIGGRNIFTQEFKKHMHMITWRYSYNYGENRTNFHRPKSPKGGSQAESWNSVSKQYYIAINLRIGKKKPTTSEPM